MAIEVTLSKDGNTRWITQHYGINDWKLRPMIIPDCARCLGVFIFWKTKEETRPTVYSVTGLHVTPYNGKSIKRIRRSIFNRLKEEMSCSVPYLMVIAGGRIDDEINKNHYQRSLKYFGFGFESRFRNTQVLVYPPEKDTMFTTFILGNDGNVHLKYKVLIK